MAIAIGNFKNGALIFGELPDLPVKVQVDVTKWRIRKRQNGFAEIFLRFGPTHFEKWVLVVKDGFLIPGYKQSENLRNG